MFSVLSASTWPQVSVSADADRYELDNSLIANINVNITNLRGSSFARLLINSNTDFTITPIKSGASAYEEFEGQKRFIWNAFPKSGSDFVSFRVRITKLYDPNVNFTVLFSYFEKETRKVIDITSTPLYFTVSTKPKEITPPSVAQTKSSDRNKNLIINNNETPKTTPSKNQERHYRIQVAALQNEKSAERVRAILKLNTTPQKDFHNGYYIYTIGEFENQQDAEKNLENVRENLPNSFIVKFEKGKRISP